jgi:hypothetical protein
MGCGKLFFEMIRGLNGQFHSKGEEFLAVLFDAFRKVEYKKYWETLNEVEEEELMWFGVISNKSFISGAGANSWKYFRLHRAEIHLWILEHHPQNLRQDPERAWKNVRREIRQRPVHATLPRPVD